MVARCLDCQSPTSSLTTLFKPSDGNLSIYLSIHRLLNLALAIYLHHGSTRHCSAPPPHSSNANCRSVSLFRILSGLAVAKSVNGAYASAGELVCLLQAAACIEVLHGALGIVPSGVLFPLMQWAGRAHFLLAIVRRISEIQESPSVFITFVAWCLSDVIRYLHYALNCLKCCPPWVTYLRYTTFIVLYPLGVAPGEMWLMFQALPFIKKTDLYADFFSSIPFNYYDFVRVLLLVYPFLWFKLYLHLFKQRRSKLGKRHEKKKN